MNLSCNKETLPEGCPSRKTCFRSPNKSFKVYLCPVHVIWTGRGMTNLVLKVCFDFFTPT